MRASEILDAAAGLVSGPRNDTHGDKLVNHTNIATLWNAWLSIRREPAEPLKPSDVAKLMVLLKMARDELGAFNLDDFTDGAAYFAIAGELRDAEWD